MQDTQPPKPTQSLEQGLAAFGLRIEDDVEPEPVVDERFEVWPETFEALILLQRVGTQWASDFGARTGVRYEVLPVIFDLYGPDAKEDRRALMEDLQTMERAILDAQAKAVEHNTKMH
jgi:hypothetical protein